jgi:hypothetical protein
MVPRTIEGHLVITLAHTIWQTIDSANAWLLKSRSGEPIMSVQERAGLNLTILLNSACYVEGNLESLLRGVLSKRVNASSAIDNGFLGRLKDDIDGRICRATGPDKHGDMFKLLVGKSLNEYAGDPESWEGIRVLFYLRNVLAHGRMAVGTITLVDGTFDTVDGTIDTIEQSEWKFEGGYGRAVEYLQRSDLASIGFEYKHVEEMIFCDPVADHFWKLAQIFSRTLRERLETEFPGAS